MSNLPTDPLFESQWWVYNTGQAVKNLQYEKTGITGIDLNVTPLWPTYTGKGIKVAVVDDGVDDTHEDLKDNFKDTLAGQKFAPATKDANHGTSVAGIIAAQKNNFGTVGVAYEATLASYNNNAPNPQQEMVNFDISSNSWGIFNVLSSDLGSKNGLDGIEKSVTEGRGSLGTVFVHSAGNNRKNLINPSGDSKGGNANRVFTKSRYVIAVAALDRNGIATSYSNPGAPLLVSAFGGSPAGIATSDRMGNNGYNPNPQAQWW